MAFVSLPSLQYVTLKCLQSQKWALGFVKTKLRQAQHVINVTSSRACTTDNIKGNLENTGKVVNADTEISIYLQGYILCFGGEAAPIPKHPKYHVFTQNMYYAVCLKGREKILCSHCEAKSNIIMTVFISLCLTMTSIDYSWEASGHTPYRIDLSSERLLCADRRMEKTNGRYCWWWWWVVYENTEQYDVE